MDKENRREWTKQLNSWPDAHHARVSDDESNDCGYHQGGCVVIIDEFTGDKGDNSLIEGK